MLIRLCGSGSGGCRDGIGRAPTHGSACRRSSSNARCLHPGSSIATSPGAKLSPEEPDAGNLHVRVCEGRGWQHPRLLGNVPLPNTAAVAADHGRPVRPILSSGDACSKEHGSDRNACPASACAGMERKRRRETSVDGLKGKREARCPPVAENLMTKIVLSAS